MQKNEGVGARMSLEIERKFLLAAFPDERVSEGKLQLISNHRIEQTYLALDEDQELRVRRLVDVESGAIEYTHTFKRGIGISREEVEYSISASIYDQVMAAFGALPLTKNRITAKWEGLVVEIDCYDQIALIVVEVEFASLEEAESFVPPAWFGKDISTSKEYSNKKVWRELQRSK